MCACNNSDVNFSRWLHWTNHVLEWLRFSYTAFPGASVVQNQTEVQELHETGAWPLDWDDSLEKGMATHSSIPARRIPWIEEPGYRQSIGGASRHHWSDLACTHKVVIYRHVVVAIQSLSCVRLFMSPRTTARQASLPFTISWSLFKHMPIELVMPSNHLELCHPLVLLPSVFPSIRVFSKESALHIRWSKYWSFSFSISPSNEYSGLISFRIDWFDLLAVQVTLKSLLQHHSLKASILQHSAFLIKCVFEGHYSVTANILDKTENQLITAIYVGFPYWKYM